MLQKYVYIKFSIILGIIIGIRSTLSWFSTLKKYVCLINTDSSWKFYVHLTFFIIFLFSTILLIYLAGYLQLKKKYFFQ